MLLISINLITMLFSNFEGAQPFTERKGSARAVCITCYGKLSENVSAIMDHHARLTYFFPPKEATFANVNPDTTTLDTREVLEKFSCVMSHFFPPIGATFPDVKPNIQSY